MRLDGDALSSLFSIKEIVLALVFEGMHAAYAL